MKQLRWFFELTLFFSAILTQLPVGEAEVTPYLPADGLDLGQGFNTFTGQGALLGAVTVSEIPDGQATDDRGLTAEEPAGDGVKFYSAEQIDTYEKLAKSLDISASANIGGWGQSASISGNYLDKSSFDTSSFTYLVKIRVEDQPSSKNKYSFNWDSTSSPEDAQLLYGDRWIKDFITGGAYFARVSIFVKEKDSTEEVGAAAEAAFKDFGVTGGFSAAVNASLDTIGKYSKVTIDKMSFGELSSQIQIPSNPTNLQDEDSNFKDRLNGIKREADEFWDKANNQKAKLYAILATYPMLRDFHKRFEPLNYEEAKLLSWPVLLDFEDYKSTEDMIKQIPEDKFQGGRETRNKLNRESSDFLETCRKWVSDVTANPAEAQSRQPHSDPQRFRAKVLENPDSPEGQSTDKVNNDVNNTINDDEEIL
ncbi:hypothetical protein G6O67_003368 [Ophiocordyceps sinensis]|uniref:Uncharacterized protein n=1 Tax=Ophiocordyceps sinensis TaxID=72228 RepID=A0A8H4PW25_9HYPO|nr:hypothetical protein G6O67_003368 [Ophiocordyceps sinensis]